MLFREMGNYSTRSTSALSVCTFEITVNENNINEENKSKQEYPPKIKVSLHVKRNIKCIFGKIVTCRKIRHDYFFLTMLQHLLHGKFDFLSEMLLGNN